ncbi:hypothetical protein LIER_41949 [Lithospermum erythrorhizon]|uniref:Uncharacterized protein n=1 Tax=Lithospermum erythrorhizon TaxID=34254 RepID=A0AAV3RKA1_LITER
MNAVDNMTQYSPAMTIILPKVPSCKHCGAYRFYRETDQICCSRGEITLAESELPPYLFDCHINVEICCEIRAVKYLYKYVHKGHDKILFRIASENSNSVVDEIANFQNAREMITGLKDSLTYLMKTRNFTTLDVATAIQKTSTDEENVEYICNICQKEVILQTTVANISRLSKLGEHYDVSAIRVELHGKVFLMLLRHDENTPAANKGKAISETQSPLSPLKRAMSEITITLGI